MGNQKNIMQFMLDTFNLLLSVKILYFRLFTLLTNIFTCFIYHLYPLLIVSLMTIGEICYVHCYIPRYFSSVGSQYTMVSICQINLSTIQSINEQTDLFRKKKNRINKNIVILYSDDICLHVYVHLYTFRCLYELKVHSSYLLSIPFVAGR